VEELQKIERKAETGENNKTEAERGTKKEREKGRDKSN
jgi:hypothetical protein